MTEKDKKPSDSKKVERFDEHQIPSYKNPPPPPKKPDSISQSDKK
jgi:hypothetical protein